MKKLIQAKKNALLIQKPDKKPLGQWIFRSQEANQAILLLMNQAGENKMKFDYWLYSYIFWDWNLSEMETLNPRP